METKEILTCDTIVRARTLALSVVEGDLKEYTRTVLIPNEARLKELQGYVDLKSLALLQAQMDLFFAQQTHKNNTFYRDFDGHMQMKPLYDMCTKLGKLKGDLLILKESYLALLKEIDGPQYIQDLVGERQQRYLNIEANVKRLLAEREYLSIALHQGLQREYARIRTLLYEHSMQSLMQRSQPGQWDRPSALEEAYETQENSDCCRRDYDYEFRQRRQLNSVHLQSPNPYQPWVLVLDAQLPRQWIQFIVQLYQTQYKFVTVDMAAWQRIDLQDDFDIEKSQNSKKEPENRDLSTTPHRTVAFELTNTATHREKASYESKDGDTRIASNEQCMRTNEWTRSHLRSTPETPNGPRKADGTLPSSNYDLQRARLHRRLYGALQTIFDRKKHVIVLAHLLHQPISTSGRYRF